MRSDYCYNSQQIRWRKFLSKMRITYELIRIQVSYVQSLPRRAIISPDNKCRHFINFQWKVILLRTETYLTTKKPIANLPPCFEATVLFSKEYLPMWSHIYAWCDRKNKNLPRLYLCITAFFPWQMQQKAYSRLKNQLRVQISVGCSLIPPRDF